MLGRALPARTRVLVIGGGPVGLIVSGLLSQRGVEHLVIERRREVRRVPAAHVLRRHSMRVMERLGVAGEVRRSAPALPLDYVTWCATLGGAEIGRLDLRPPDPATGERPPEPWTNCPQSVLEPILLDHAERQPPAVLALGAECVEIAQDADGVSLRIRRDDGIEQGVAAAWAIAADGAGSPTRRRLGIPMQGAGPLGRFSMVHFEADLRPWIGQRSGPLFWILNPESPGCLIVHDPRCSHVFMTPSGVSADEAPAIADRIAAALAVPVAPRILAVDRWSPHVQVAARYRDERVFLVGDAAHRFPPTGGLGLNTGIQEAEDLVARLGRVEVGGEDPALLEGYERRCRPVALANARRSFENLVRLGEIARVIGDWPDLPALEQRLASLDQAERARLADAIEAQRGHFLWDGHPLAPPIGAGGERGAGALSR